MLPLNSSFYVDNIQKYDNNKFIYYSGDMNLNKEYAMCYNVALSQTWGSLF